MIEQLTLWDVSDLFSYWQDYPPTHVLVAAYLLGNQRHRSPKRAGGGLDELKASVTFAGGSVKRHLPAIYRLQN